jgi:hypothetical protein
MDIPIGHFQRDLLGDEIAADPSISPLANPFGLLGRQEAVDRRWRDLLEFAGRLLIDLEFAQRTEPPQFLLDQWLQPMATRPVEDLPEPLQGHPHNPPVHRLPLVPQPRVSLKKPGQLPERGLSGHARIAAIFV